MLRHSVSAILRTYVVTLILRNACSDLRNLARARACAHKGRMDMRESSAHSYVEYFV